MSRTTHADGEPFWRELLGHIVTKGRRIPKFQVERAVGPILGYFMEKEPRLLGGDTIVLAAEFPLRKPGGGYQSTNVDWLLYDRGRRELVLLELKTESGSFRGAQFETYLAVAAEQSPWTRLKDDFDRICAVSASGRYDDARRDLEAAAARCADLQRAGVRVLYLAPEATRTSFRLAHGDFARKFPGPAASVTVEFRSFTELREGLRSAEAGGGGAGYRDVLCDVLCGLDRDDARESCGGDAGENPGRNYRGLASLDEVLQLCRGDTPILVGFDGGPPRLRRQTVADLHARQYKWDWADAAGRGVTGGKSLRNRIAGREFVALVDHVRARRLRSEHDGQRLLARLGEVLRRHPELRLGQIVAQAWPETEPSLGEVDDEDFVAALGAGP